LLPASCFLPLASCFLPPASTIAGDLYKSLTGV
jgi:hypothetical protein